MEKSFGSQLFSFIVCIVMLVLIGASCICAMLNIVPFGFAFATLIISVAVCYIYSAKIE